MAKKPLQTVAHFMPKLEYSLHDAAFILQGREPAENQDHASAGMLRMLLEAVQAGKLQPRIAAVRVNVPGGAFGESIPPPLTRRNRMFPSPAPSAPPPRDPDPPSPRDSLVLGENLSKWVVDNRLALGLPESKRSSGQTARHAAARAEYLAAALACLWNSLPKEHQLTPPMLATRLVKESVKQLGYERGVEAIRQALSDWKHKQSN